MRKSASIYAAPPVGELRWRPPVAAQPWKGVRLAAQFGAACAQVTTLGVFAGPANDNEDCLTLNVFTPHVEASGKLPVIVWIHGGGNMDGASRDYDASRLAALGKTVVVTINYRLGLLGWLANPALDAEGHPFANYVLLDQQLALKWVKANIAAFGGDPGNVTLGGQSAGSIDTEASVASPMAAGLFQRAIFESVVLGGTPLPAAKKLGADFADVDVPRPVDLATAQEECIDPALGGAVEQLYPAIGEEIMRSRTQHGESHELVRLLAGP
jgi:para-nitrobenzyl esterase